MGTNITVTCLANPKEVLRFYENLEAPSSESAMTLSALFQHVLDRYRCPETFLDFELSANSSGDFGYFQVGSAKWRGRTLLRL